MPYDDNLARIKAEMLMQNRPLYDDGASELESGPGMMQVGLFGRGPKPTKPVAPPVDMQRRSILGLKPQAEYPVPAIRATDIPVPTSNFPAPAPQQIPAPAQEAPMPAQPVSPLQSLANKAMNAPISRREVLKKAGQAAVGQILPTPSVTNIIPEIMSPLAEAAKEVIASPAQSAMPHAAIWASLKDLIKEGFDEDASGDPTNIREKLDEYHGMVDPTQLSAKELKQAHRLGRKYDKLLNSDAEGEDLYDIQDRMSEHVKKAIGAMSHENVISELENVGYDINAYDIASLLKDKGFNKQEIADFLDENHPGFEYDEFMGDDAAIPSAPKTTGAKPQTLRLDSVFEHPDQPQAFESWAIGQSKAGVEGGEALREKAIALAGALRLARSSTDPKMLKMLYNRGMSLANTLRGLNRNDEANQVESWTLNKGK
jgi:hypothetical protein